jgi:hypothetical protein
MPTQQATVFAVNAVTRPANRNLLMTSMHIVPVVGEEVSK